ncbi:hypothetical protein [Candidatus Nitronereus thalassa]|uniref:Uncharacterized protein n=1 Tax=Candidatus Nitronereus thalassa TaxID=3020898 RepID=A0ABU3K8N0_9BACT|nr:hypothetical protein [Candidatus Nitronereus thalassa]MDT7042750.1 hypothetical protein [Candidatus Nitronereus thalassa]
MPIQDHQEQYIQITETVLRLYVLLNQYLDRCHDEAAKAAFPESEFQEHLRTTREKAAELLASNRIVKEKVAVESERILQLGVDWVARSSENGMNLQLAKERNILQIKTLTLSDLLAVFRSM